MKLTYFILLIGLKEQRNVNGVVFLAFSKACNKFSQDRLVNKVTVWLIGFAFIITKNIKF